MQLSDGNSICHVVNKFIRSLNRTNRPNRQTCKGSLLLMRCNFRMENTICHIEHNIFHSSNRTDRNSTCRVVNKIFHSPNRTNRPNRQACNGSLSLMRCNFRMENTICHIEHNIFHSSNRTNRNSTCRVVNKIFHSPNKTNRLNRQTCKGSLSIMRCNCRIENSTCRIVQKFLYSPNRTNRSNRTSVFSDRIQLTVLDMDALPLFIQHRKTIKKIKALSLRMFLACSWLTSA